MNSTLPASKRSVETPILDHLSPQSGLITSEELASRWRISPGTLRNWRWSGQGPAAVRIGTRVRYHLADITKYEQENRSTNTTSNS